MTKLVECSTTGKKMPETLAREVDSLSKSLPADCGYRTKALVADQITFEEGERADVSTLTTNSVDKSNEVVLPEGVDLEAYRKSMVVLWQHDQERPVATCQWIKHYRNSIRAKTLYPAEGPQLTQDAWAMTKSGILKAKSIGFFPRKPLREPTQEELAAHPDWKGAGVWDDVLMFEYSCVSVGCNNDALVEAVAKGLSEEALKALGIEVPTLTPAAETPVEVVAQAVVQEVVKSIPEWVTKAESDDCVSNKIKYMYDHGEDAKYSREQIAAIAIAMCRGKSSKKKTKKSIDINKILAQALNGITLDVEAMARKAIDAYKNRGRV